MPAVGFATSFDTEPYAGLVTRVVVHADGCRNPVHVAVAVGGTSEVWSLGSRRSLSRVQALAVGVAGTAVDNPRVDAVVPYALVEQGFENAVQHTRAVHYDGAARTSSGTMVIAADVSGWARAQEPLEARFDANWIAPRSFTSCYLRLPALLGDRVSTASSDAGTLLPRLSAHHVQSNPNDVTGWVSFGATDLVTDLDVRVDLSQPPPSDAFEHEWTCTGVFAGLTSAQYERKISVVEQSGTSEPLRYYLDLPHDAKQCEALAVLEDPARVTLENVLLLIAGAVGALGLTLIVEAAVRRRRRTAGPAA
jgi:hypothetical protein